MSPQPDVVLDVQKYIGPCLISQKPRGRKAGRSKEKLGVHSSVHQVHHFRKNSGVGPPPPTSLPHSSVNSSYTICECCGNFKYMFNGTGPPPPPTSGNLPWAGYPLISLAGFKKNTNKPIAHHNGGLPIQGINNRNRLISQSETENVLDSGGVCSLSPPLWDDPDCLPLSKLAIHTQGVPLILANHVNYKKYKHLPSYGGKIQHSSRNNIRHFKERFELSSNNDSQSEVICHQIESDTGDKLLESSSVAEPSFSQAKELDTLNQRNISEVDVSRSSPSASDSMSITSDESSGLSECSLPRILKPRKRRKRDRWLHNGDSNVNIASNSNGLKTLLTLEPYRPLCYRFNQPDLKDDGTDECEKTFNCPDNSWSKFQETLPNESEDEDSCVTNGAAVVEEDLQRYPYPPSPFCTCSICSPRSLPTPPTSPSSGHSSSISSLPSSPSSESFLSLPLNSSSPFPTPPPSPSSLSVVDSDPLSWTYSTYQVDTKIVTTEDGSKDLEIKFISSINNSSNEKLSSVDNSSNVIIKHVQSCTSDQKPAFKTPSLSKSFLCVSISSPLTILSFQFVEFIY